jgi:uncharacterized protein (DUF2237 family)
MDTVILDRMTRETTVLPVSDPSAAPSIFSLPHRKCITSYFKSSKSDTSLFLATLTDSFLDFSASKGNNLRKIGLTAGCKWCLCANRWKEALDHANKNKNDPATQSIVPKVHLHATHERALDVISMVDLKSHASDGEAGNVR